MSYISPRKKSLGYESGVGNLYDTSVLIPPLVDRLKRAGVIVSLTPAPSNLTTGGDWDRMILPGYGFGMGDHCKVPVPLGW